MLPTLARHSCPSTVSRSRGRRVAPPCTADPDLFTDPVRAPEAEAVCDRCPLATRCLLTALALHRARLAGEDRWGARGCYGGVWFDPDRGQPQRIPHSPAA